MIEAYKKFWKGYVDFEGRSTRSDYWFVYLVNVLITFAFFCSKQYLEDLQVLQNQAFWLLFHSYPIYLFGLWYCCHLTWSCCNSSSFA